MNTTQIVAIRNLHASTNAPERTMTAKEMALVPWGNPGHNVNRAPDGARFVWNEARRIFVAH